MRYRVTKTFGHEAGLSCCFRQWRSEGHCRFLHGYALAVRLEFEANELDDHGWVLDFGGLKSFRGWLESMFDHKTLVAEDDPEIDAFRALNRAGLIDMVVVQATGCEAFASLILAAARRWLDHNGYGQRVEIMTVEVSEHGANSASVSRE